MPVAVYGSVRDVGVIPPGSAANRPPGQFVDPPNLVNMAVDGAGVEVVGSESVDDRINRQQREAEKAGQVVDFSGDGGATDMDVAEQEQIRNVLFASFASKQAHPTRQMKVL